MKKIAIFVCVFMFAQYLGNAQSDSFFRGGNDNYTDRATINDNDGSGISNWGIGETVPLGSGL